MHMSLINDGVYQEGRMHQINNVHLILHNQYYLNRRLL